MWWLLFARLHLLLLSNRKQRVEGGIFPFLFLGVKKGMKKLSGLVTVCAMVALISVATATVTGPEGLPDLFYAGSETTLTYTIHGEPGPIKVDFSISNDTYEIGENETKVTIVADGRQLNCNEYKPGYLDCDEYDGKKTSIVDVTFSTVPNLLPQEYLLNFTVRYGEEQVTVTRRTGGGNPDVDGDGISNTDEILAGTDWRNPCDPDPHNEACYAIGGTRPTPIPTPTQTPEVTSGATTPEETPTPTPVPTPEKKLPWWILLIVGAGAGIAYLWRRRR